MKYLKAIFVIIVAIAASVSYYYERHKPILKPMDVLYKITSKERVVIDYFHLHQDSCAFSIRLGQWPGKKKAILDFCNLSYDSIEVTRLCHSFSEAKFVYRIDHKLYFDYDNGISKCISIAGLGNVSE